MNAVYLSKFSKFFASVPHVLVFFPPQPKLTPQLTPRRPLNLADQRSSLMFESCETISITSLGKSHVSSLCTRHHGHTHIIITLNTSQKSVCSCSITGG